MQSKIKLYRISITILAPAVMMASFIYHPHVGKPIDADFLEKLAAAVMADTTRWGVAHYMAGVGCGLMVLAFLAIHNHLRESADDSWSSFGLPFIILGSTLYAMLPAMEFAPMAAAEINADIQSIQAALMPWFVPTLFISAVLFAIGAAGFAAGFVRGGVENPRLKWLIAGALITMAVSRFIPLNMIHFYVQGLAGILAFWPMAYVMRHYSGTQSADQPKLTTAVGQV
ncbi:hypothetical protein BH23BAC3_BH23BAC3_14990 [soil metagenome]